MGYLKPHGEPAWIATEVSCPRCCKHTTVSVPKGAEKDLLVELEDEDVDEVGRRTVDAYFA